MKFRQIGDSPQTFILVFEAGDELTAGLLNFGQGAEALGGELQSDKCSVLCAP